MITCLIGGLFALHRTNTRAAEIATDYMEDMQALTYTTTVNGEEVTLSYRLYVPHDYDASKAYPLFTMLHGHGGQGNDNETQLNVFKPLLSRLTTVEQLERDPAIIVVPQSAPTTSGWRSTTGRDTIRWRRLTFLPTCRRSPI
ncbi:MAG TPA: hypothetical protein H9676_05750 [Firmicutes bacterium]|nr:hypothetical protein [Bacillota bacterium]